MTVVTEKETTPYQERARRGAAFLDEHRTDHWRERIDLDKLDIGNECTCVLGQLYGHYGDGVEALKLEDANKFRLGFEFAGDGYTEAYWLNRAWKEQLT